MPLMVITSTSVTKSTEPKSILLSIRVIHDSQVYSDPESFRLERWLKLVEHAYGRYECPSADDMAFRISLGP